MRECWFELTLPSKLDQAETAWLAAQSLTPEPFVVNEPLNDEQQTGDSRLLGGPISIHAPWSRE
jgi:hypothetical protein